MAMITADARYLNGPEVNSSEMKGPRYATPLEEAQDRWQKSVDMARQHKARLEQIKREAAQAEEAYYKSREIEETAWRALAEVREQQLSS